MSNGKGAIRAVARQQGYSLGYMLGCAEGDRRTKAAAVQPVPAEYEQQISLLVGERLAVERKLAACTSERNKARFENAQLRHDNGVLQHQNNKLQDDLTCAENDLAKIEADLSDCRKELHDRNELVDQLRSALTDMSEKHANLVRCNDAQREIIENLQDRAKRDARTWEAQCRIITNQRQQLRDIEAVCKR